MSFSSRSSLSLSLSLSHTHTHTHTHTHPTGAAPKSGRYVPHGDGQYQSRVVKNPTVNPTQDMSAAAVHNKDQVGDG